MLKKLSFISLIIFLLNCAACSEDKAYYVNGTITSITGLEKGYYILYLKEYPNVRFKAATQMSGYPPRMYPQPMEKIEKKEILPGMYVMVSYTEKDSIKDQEYILMAVNEIKR